MSRLEILQEKVSSVCKSRREIIAAYLFGSCARGKGNMANDVDIALLLDDDQEVHFPYLEFKVLLERLLDINVDLIILNRAGEVLKYQVRKYGRIIYVSDPKIRKQWEILSRKLYEDYLYLHHIYMKKLYDYYGVENG